MINNLITSKTRIKLHLKFFINSQTTAYTQNLKSEIGESTNTIRQELKRNEKDELMYSKTSCYKKVFLANIKYPFFSETIDILIEYTLIDQIINEIVLKYGTLTMQISQIIFPKIKLANLSISYYQNKSLTKCIWQV
jgi:hypothetical protein